MHSLDTKTVHCRDSFLATVTTGIWGIPWGSLGARSRTLDLVRQRVDRDRSPADRIRHTSRCVDLLAHRLLVLGGIALLGAVLALAVVERRSQDGGSASASAPASWNTAFAGSRGQTGDAQRTTCGQVLAAQALGRHPSRAPVRREDRASKRREPRPERDHRQHARRAGPAARGHRGARANPGSRGDVGDRVAVRHRGDRLATLTR